MSIDGFDKDNSIPIPADLQDINLDGLKKYFKGAKRNKYLTFNGDSTIAKNYLKDVMRLKKIKMHDYDCDFNENKCNDTYDICGLKLLYHAAIASDESEHYNRSMSSTSTFNEEIKQDKSITENKLLSDSFTEFEIEIQNEMKRSPETIRIVTKCPSNPQYRQNSNESRLDYLYRFPTLQQAAVNSYDLTNLNYLTNEVFTVDCVIKSQFLNEYRGRDKWYDKYVAVLKTIPDFYLANTSPILYGRCIVIKQYCYGTTGVQTGLNNSSKTDYLWNPFKALPVEKMDAKMLALKAKYDKFLSEGKLCKFSRVMIIFYMLNEEMTHIEQVVSYCDSFDIFESNIDEYF